MGTVDGQDATSLHEQRARRASTVFATLSERYRGAPEGFDATFQIRLGDVGRTWEIRLRGDRCEVQPSARREPDVIIGTDASTWLALREGRMSSLDAFSQRRLYARGDLDLGLAFEGMFELPGGRDPLVRIADVEVGRTRIKTLIAGGGPTQVVCLHGLGANKTSFFETMAAFAGDCTVHALDLPGFGSSDKPSLGAYNAPWFADRVLGYMDSSGIDSAHLIGNSMGGRIALEVAFKRPERVDSLSLLAPSMAWRRRRELAPIVRLVRPELASIPHTLREATVRAQFWSLFARPERLDPATADIAADEFLRTYRTRAGRVAFFAALRNIYLDEPHGVDGFWSRLAHLRPPALFVWGDEDRLVPAGFSRHVAEALPAARQVVLDECGHVPQVELPERTNRLVRDHVLSAAAPAAAEPTEAGGVLSRALRRAG
jgi:pimeloyl-ACP methyl ester carboxylesterase